MGQRGWIGYPPQMAVGPGCCGYMRVWAIPESLLLFQILIRNRATDLDARMHDGTTPLILTARLAVEGMLEELITSHADVNAVDDLGEQGWLVWDVHAPANAHAVWGPLPICQPPTCLLSHSPNRQVCTSLGSCSEQCGGSHSAAEEWCQQGHAEQQGL